MQKDYKIKYITLCSKPNYIQVNNYHNTNLILLSYFYKRKSVLNDDNTLGVWNVKYKFKTKEDEKG